MEVEAEGGEMQMTAAARGPSPACGPPPCSHPCPTSGLRLVQLGVFFLGIPHPCLGCSPPPSFCQCRAALAPRCPLRLIFDNLPYPLSPTHPYYLPSTPAFGTRHSSYCEHLGILAPASTSNLRLFLKLLPSETRTRERLRFPPGRGTRTRTMRRMRPMRTRRQRQGRREERVRKCVFWGEGWG